MTLKVITEKIEEEDIVKEIQLTTSPVEFLVIGAALKQYAENPNNHDVDIEVAKSIRKTIVERI